MLNQVKQIGFILAIVMVSIISSCATVIPMQIFLLEGDKNQYYIPESRTCRDGHELSLALTFIEDSTLELPVTINYTITAPEKNISVPIRESMISSSGVYFDLQRYGVLYREIHGKKGTVRISASMSRDKFLEMLSTGVVSIIIVYRDGMQFEFALSDRLKDDLEKIRLYLISY